MYIYMIRMRRDLDILSDAVKTHIYDENSTSQLTLQDVSINQEIQKLIPFEIKITKAKDGEKDKFKYLLFSGSNTKIYDNMDEFILDLPEHKRVNKELYGSLNLLGNENSKLSLISDTEDIDLI